MREISRRPRWLSELSDRRYLAGPLIRLVVLLVVLAALAALAVTGSLPWQAPYQGPLASDFPRNTLLVNFGIQRVSQTRSILVSTGTSLAAAQATLTARLSADLVEYPKLQQFPADQITLTATPAGPSQVEIVATLNPTNPEKAADGLFTGTISVSAGSKVFSVPVAVYLAPKSGYRAVLAFLLLLLGAIFGLSVKWVTEALSVLAAARWRFEAIVQRLGHSRAVLPTSVNDRLNDIGTRITRQDVGQLDDLFAPLESALVSLRAFSANIANINDEIDVQEDRGRGRNLPVDEVVREERRQVSALLNEEWPWRDANATLGAAKLLGDQAKTATRAITEGRSDVVRLFAEGEFEQACTLYSTPPQGTGDSATQPGPPDAAGAVADEEFSSRYIRGPGSYSVYRPFRWLSLLYARGLIQWMTDRPRSLAAAASILVVSIVGLQLQYLNSTSFDGSLADWLNLMLWAAVIELSGVSVLDVVGRLSGSGPGPRPVTR